MVQTKPKQNLVSLIRKLRPLLPGKVEKIKTTEYLIDGKCTVILNYYCRWWNRGDKPLDEKECYPSSITVSAVDLDREQLKKLFGSNKFVCDYVPSKVFHTRTIQKRASDGEFNLESVATAVTRCLESVNQWVIDCRERQKKQYRTEALLSRVKRDLLFGLPEGAKSYGNNSVIYNVGNLTCKIYIYTDEDEHGLAKYEMEVEGLDLIQMNKLRKAIYDLN